MDGPSEIPGGLPRLDERSGSATQTAPSEQPAERPVNVLMMNLPFRVRWQDLKDLCRQACPIERADVALEIDGRSRGFGEVTCLNRSDADKLFAMFDGHEWQNRRLNVIVMDSQGTSTSKSGSLSFSGPPGAGFGGPSKVQEFRAPSALVQPQAQTDDKLLFIGNLPFSMQWQDLKDLLRPAGRVQRTDVSMASDGRSRGWGTALFYTADEAQAAVDMFNETEVEGRRIKVRLDRLGGRGVPANLQSLGGPSNLRSRGGPSPLTSAMQQQQQQHPGSYPLQQNNSVTLDTYPMSLGGQSSAGPIYYQGSSTEHLQPTSGEALFARSRQEEPLYPTQYGAIRPQPPQQQSLSSYPYQARRQQNFEPQRGNHEQQQQQQQQPRRNQQHQAPSNLYW